MPKKKHPTPRDYKGVTISSTFTDLRYHRAALIRAIKGQGLTDVAMENDAAKPNLDIIDSSLQMVRDGSAYIGVISRKYGQTPECPNRNPGKVSITELEFNEAQRLKRPILLFIMGEGHPLIEADVESKVAKKKKLRAFRERAKRIGPDSLVHRVYATFSSLEEFKEQAIHAVSDLRRYLDERAASLALQPQERDKTQPDPIPKAPAFYAEPPYIGSHEFLGRKAQLDTLSDWASSADPHTILLFEAIGGAGKSMLTWEWTTKHATKVRADWAGRFWYSFYEKGAIMADFCQRTLAYITGQPLEDFQKKKTAELGELLLHHLQACPWLLILDGLERVLVAYHRFDAAQLVDEHAGTTDEIAHRDPCTAIRPEDDDLLRSLAAAAPSKILITSRLIPRVLLNSASQPIPGVLRVLLRGLRPADAEQLLRAGGVTGTSREIQNYLKSHCDCHPLVTGVLAGLINDYLPNRGNFDDWASDAEHGGGRLNLANLDLIQKRNHILLAALNALPEKSRQLLSTLALLSEAVDYPILTALNPYVPPEPNRVDEPDNPEVGWRWGQMTDEQREDAQQKHKEALQRRKEYEQALKTRLQSAEFLAAPEELTKTVRDLERRGLLQYDAQSRRYDLHPVVRGVAAGRLKQDEKEDYGQRVVDHFSRRAHNPYEEAKTLEDVSDALHVIRTLLQMGRYQQACDAFSLELAIALDINLEAHAVQLSLLRPFFPYGWANMPAGVTDISSSWLARVTADAFMGLDEPKEALALYGGSLVGPLKRASWPIVSHCLYKISRALFALDRLAEYDRIILLNLDIAGLIEGHDALIWARLQRFHQLNQLGRLIDAEAEWQLLDSMLRDSSDIRDTGAAAIVYVRFRFFRGDLTDEHLAYAEQLAKATKNRSGSRQLLFFRGEWQFEQGEWALAAESFQEAVRMAREVGQRDAYSETMLALAKLAIHQLPDAAHEAEELAGASSVFDLALARLWLAIGDVERAKKHALVAYRSAWANGEPYVYRYRLNQAQAILEQLGAGVPELPPHDSAKDEKLPWEDDLIAGLEKLRAEKKTERKKAQDKREQERQEAKRSAKKTAAKKDRSNKSAKAGSLPSSRREKTSTRKKGTSNKSTKVSS